MKAPESNPRSAVFTTVAWAWPYVSERLPEARSGQA